MSKIKLNVLGKCPYCGAPNTKKINETEYLCNHCGQTSFIEKELKAYDSSNLNLKDIIVKSNSNTQSELEKTIKYLVNISKTFISKIIKFSQILIRKLKDFLFIAIRNFKVFKERWNMIDSETKAVMFLITIVMILVWVT